MLQEDVNLVRKDYLESSSCNPKSFFPPIKSYLSQKQYDSLTDKQLKSLEILEKECLEEFSFPLHCIGQPANIGLKIKYLEKLDEIVKLHELYN